MSFSTHTNGSSAQGSVAAALAYHHRGWRVTPLDGKRPTTHDWQTARISPEQSAQMPKIPVTPMSYHDIWPVLQHLGGPDSPREWQGALPFTYHVGPGPARLKMHLKQDYQFRTLIVGGWPAGGRRRLPGGPVKGIRNL